ncbi:MAG: L-histidine N(alpha)-methyltransferase, partial [bacterium]|nr:L-histidine N(alpha)-methyltransferase [bacterium]
PTRTELGILTDEGDAIVEALAGRHRLIELGSGSSAKTRLLIEALLDRQATLHYLPVDISPTALEGSAQELGQSYPALQVTALAADYATALRAIADDPDPSDHERTLVVFLGSAIGNLEPDEARELLAHARRLLRPGDSLLLGADLKKSAEILIPAYDDALGVTAAFNLNLLVR